MPDIHNVTFNQPLEGENTCGTETPIPKETDTSKEDENEEKPTVTSDFF